MMNVKKLPEIQIEALREVANIGSGHAATALSQLFHKKITIRIPEIITGKLQDVVKKVSNPENVVSSVLINAFGDLTGRSLILYPYNDATKLTFLLMAENQEDSLELRKSLLNKVSNILSGSYMNALGALLGLLIFQTVPRMSINTVSAVISNVINNSICEKDFIFCIITEFHYDKGENPLNAFFLLISDDTSLEIILKRLNLMKFGRKI